MTHAGRVSVPELPKDGVLRLVADDLGNGPSDRRRKGEAVGETAVGEYVAASERPGYAHELELLRMNIVDAVRSLRNSVLAKPPFHPEPVRNVARASQRRVAAAEA